MQIDGDGHKAGNFSNYYHFHPTKKRESLLSGADYFRQIWKSSGFPKRFHILDIGCNEGDLSIACFNMAQAELGEDVECSILGVDIDEVLIERAQKKSVGLSRVKFVRYE
jgi:ribosomal protein L11 methylase PrmA